jgi:hypothetical protein
MKMVVENGRLKLGSLYKAVVVGWIYGFGFFFGVVLFLLLLVSLLTGQMMVNGEMVYGRGRIFLEMLPILIVFPIAIVMNALMLGGLVIGGLALYRKRRPIELVDENQKPIVTQIFD